MEGICKREMSQWHEEFSCLLVSVIALHDMALAQRWLSPEIQWPSGGTRYAERGAGARLLLHALSPPQKNHLKFVYTAPPRLLYSRSGGTLKYNDITKIVSVILPTTIKSDRRQKTIYIKFPAPLRLTQVYFSISLLRKSFNLYKKKRIYYLLLNVYLFTSWKRQNYRNTPDKFEPFTPRLHHECVLILSLLGVCSFLISLSAVQARLGNGIPMEPLNRDKNYPIGMY